VEYLIQIHFFNNGIILDDAHAAENYIAKYWSLLIERSNQQEDHSCSLFTLVSAIRDVVSPEHYSRLISPSKVSVICSGLKNFLPYTLFSKFRIDCTMDEQEEKTLRHPWCSEIIACQMYLSVNSILIRPHPTNSTHHPFQLRNSAFICLQHLGRWRIGAALGWKNSSFLEGWEQQGGRVILPEKVSR